MMYMNYSKILLLFFHILVDDPAYFYVEFCPKHETGKYLPRYNNCNWFIKKLILTINLREHSQLIPSPRSLNITETSSLSYKVTYIQILKF